MTQSILYLRNKPNDCYNCPLILKEKEGDICYLTLDFINYSKKICLLTPIKKQKYNTNDKVGHLTIIKDTGKRKKDGCKIYLCKCECGNIIERSTDSFAQSLKRGHEISCGCKLKEKTKAFDIGNRYSQDKNRIEKARIGIGQYEGTTMQGIQRLSLNKNNRSGYRGVTLNKNGTYRARLMFKGKEHSINHIKTLEKAIKKRKELEEKYYAPIIEEYNDLYGEFRKKRERRGKDK